MVTRWPTREDDIWTRLPNAFLADDSHTMAAHGVRIGEGDCCCDCQFRSYSMEKARPATLDQRTNVTRERKGHADSRRCIPQTLSLKAALLSDVMQACPYENNVPDTEVSFRAQI